MNVNSEEQFERFNRFYGGVQKQQNERIMALITGESVLDVGCGYGFLIRQLMESQRFKTVSGIDVDAQSVEIACKIHRSVDAKVLDVYNMDFPENRFDTVIFRESIHHLDIEKALNCAKKICSKEIIVFDPNPNLIVKLARKLIGHRDEIATPGMLEEACERNGLTVKDVEYSDVMAFPLSGGLVGIEVCPNVNCVKKALIILDQVLAKLLKLLKLQRHFCWRYLMRIEVNRG